MERDEDHAHGKEAVSAHGAGIRTPADLPLELLSRILSLLEIETLLRAAQTCAAFCAAADVAYRAIRLDRTKGLDQRDATESMSYSEVKNALLGQYGYSVGLWSVRSTDYGGLLHIRFDGYQLVGVRYDAPRSIDQPLRHRRVLTIRVVSSAVCSLTCHQGYVGSHDCRLTRTGASEFEMTCAEASLHSRQDETEKEYQQWLCEKRVCSTARCFMQEYKQWLCEERQCSMAELAADLELWPWLKRRKFSALANELTMRCSRLSLPGEGGEGGHPPMPPGLFKGTYSAHGIELVLLRYSGEGESYSASIVKITGDGNVPATEVTIRADLGSQCEALAGRGSGAETGAGVGASKERQAQDFTLDPGYHRETVIPDRCVARFTSECQIAADGHQTPEFIEGEWVVFDDDTFGNDFKVLNSFSMYSRVKETLPIQRWVGHEATPAAE